MSRLRFLHIPKTAGTTFQNILFWQCRRRKNFSFSGDAELDIRRFGRLGEDEKQRIGLFVGHAPITTGIAEADRAQIITFLREPIGRVRSFCQHVSEGKSPYLQNLWSSTIFDLDLFLESGNEELENLQAQMLIGDWRHASSFSINHLSPAEARDLALASLTERVAHFGLQERFDESLLLFKESLRWSPPLYFSRNMKSTTESLRFHSRHLNRIAELNSIDIEVYKIASDIFQRRITEVGVDEGKLRRFRLMQTLFSVTEPYVSSWQRLRRRAELLLKRT